MQTVTERVTLEITEGPEWFAEHNGEHWEHHAWTVRLTRGAVSMDVPWRAGIGITDDPTARDVLEALLLDASGIENARGDFEEWAREYGFDPDSRRAERIFKQATEQTEKLRALLGDDYDDAVFPTARDNYDSERIVRRLAEEV